MDASNIMYPQYWLQLEPKARFIAHLAILKDALASTNLIRS
jgi:hypothetical protein